MTVVSTFFFCLIVDIKKLRRLIHEVRDNSFIQSNWVIHVNQTQLQTYLFIYEPGPNQMCDKNFINENYVFF